MRTLSKSKVLAFRQCPKRLWLEIHKPELRDDSAATKASFVVGHQVGEIAQNLYDPKGTGVLIDPKTEGYPAAIARTQALLATDQTIFEATFSADGGFAMADILLPAKHAGKRVWRMVEVKSSTKVKDYYKDDAAIQSQVARAAGVPLQSIALAHIDSKWVYPGGKDYQGLLREQDLSEAAFNRAEEVKEWIAEAQKIAARRSEPLVTTGGQCTEPYACGFFAYCRSHEPQPEHPAIWLPNRKKKSLKALVHGNYAIEMTDVSDHLLNETQKRVKEHTVSGEIFFDAGGAAADLAQHKLPAYFLDFETIMFAVPIWKGTRPYQQIVFQFSVHHLSKKGELTDQAFLDLSGEDPSKKLAEALLAACGGRGPVFVYNAGFEKTRIKELAARFPGLKVALLAINDRIVDLCPIAEQHYYHPSQRGSWSIKKVLPAAIPELRYDDLDGVKDGGMAMTAYMEAVAPGTTAARKAQIDKQLRAYCGLDTLAMVRLWQMFAGRADLRL